MKALITGAGGQLGAELQRTAPAEVTVAAYDRAGLDVTATGEVDRIVATERPDLIVNCAAYTAVDRAEEEPAAATGVNEAGAGAVARAAAGNGARLIHLSTDFVFDGESGRPYRPDDAPRPLGVYGASKLAGERRVAEATGGAALIVRTSWLYSRHGRNFVTTLLDLMTRRDELRVVSDQVGSPTWARGLARAIWRLARQPELRGIVHWSDAGIASWYDFAVAIHEEAAAAGLIRRRVRIRPIPTAEYPTPARRPAFSVLDKSATWRIPGLAPTHWREALREMLSELEADEDD